MVLLLLTISMTDLAISPITNLDQVPNERNCNIRSLHKLVVPKQPLVDEAGPYVAR